jgi:DNA topoisomerase-2
MNNYIYDNDSGKSMGLAFSKFESDNRKEWLYNYDNQLILDQNETNIPIQDFINRELIHFSNSDTYRSIGSIYDGLKPSQRKILYSCFKRNLFKEIRVAQLAGYVSENAAYHHGEASLQSAIIGMAQNFIGSNNLNLLMPNGQFGTRIMGGHDSASPRYIHTELNKIVTLLYPPADFPLLDYNDDDGVYVEPKYYIPIIPMVLVNGMNGIGTGFSTSIPKYDIKDVTNNILKRLKGEMYTKIHPNYNNFKGQIIQLDNKNYMSKGIYKIINSTILDILELPIGKWTDDYKNFLDSLIEDTKKNKDDTSKKKKKTFITDYINNSSDTEINFRIILPKGVIQSLQWSEDKHIDGIEKFFKLTTTKGLSLSNIHLYDKGKIVKYTSLSEIFDTFYEERYKLYKVRKEYQCKELLNSLQIIESKIRFIKDVIEEQIIIYKRKKLQIMEALFEKQYLQVKDKKVIQEIEDDINTNNYDYLIKMSLYTFTEEEIDRLHDEYKKLKDKYDILMNLTIEEIWRSECLELLKNINKLLV